MSDQTIPAQSLSEISHLFLSTLRERAAGTAGGPARPVRIPPGQRRDLPRPITIDLTPEEFAEVIAEPEGKASDLPPVAPVTAVIAHHFGPRQAAHVRDYARHLCVGGERIGLIEVEASELRLMCFEHNPHGGAAGSAPAEATIDTLDGRRIEEALNELAWDINRWLLVVPNSRSTEARALLRRVDGWTMLATCDHDGIVACYRTLKGLADLRRCEDGTVLPSLSLALVDVPDAASAGRIYRKLASVCQQFLDWPVDQEPSVVPAHEVAEHLILACEAGHDKAQIANGPQWQILADFFGRASAAPLPITEELEAADELAEPGPVGAAPEIEAPAEVMAAPEPASAVRSEMESFSIPLRPPVAAPVEATPPRPAPMSIAGSEPEVIDLPSGQMTSTAIVSAVLKSGGQLIECPVRPPMCPDASLAVSRDRTLVLVAVARQGLTDLRLISQAYRWLSENRALIAMAMPQMSIDAHALPQLQLLVDREDLSADLLQPMLQSSSVTVHAYRKLRWAGKTGLLLEAA